MTAFGTSWWIRERLLSKDTLQEPSQMQEPMSKHCKPKMLAHWAQTLSISVNSKPLSIRLHLLLPPDLPLGRHPCPGSQVISVPLPPGQDPVLRVISGWFSYKVGREVLTAWPLSLLLGNRVRTLRILKCPLCLRETVEVLGQVCMCAILVLQQGTLHGPLSLQ